MKFIFIFLISLKTLAEVTLNVPGLSPMSPASPAASVRPLTVDNFLDPLTDSNRNRPSSWPERLTFSEPLVLTASEATAILERSRNYRVVYHCDGKVIEARDLARMRGYDGYINESAQLEFFNNQITRRVFPAGKRNQPTSGKVNNTCSFTIAREPSSISRFVQSYSSCARGTWDALNISFLRVNETGESVVSAPTINIKCPSGSLLESLLVPMNSDAFVSQNEFF